MTVSRKAVTKNLKIQRMVKPLFDCHKVHTAEW